MKPDMTGTGLRAEARRGAGDDAEGRMQSREAAPALSGGQADLVLGGHRLRLASGDRGLLAGAVSVLAPPCRLDHASEAGADWVVDAAFGMPQGLSASMADDLPELGWRGSGRRLVVLGAGSGVVRVAATYRRGAATALIEADAGARRTRVLVPAGDTDSGRWPDWVARLFFGSRMLADRWLLLHASAVRVAARDGDRALVVVAGQQGGKSTAAYRACAELGAALMADDLVLVHVNEGTVEVAGWPARACVPVEVLSREVMDSVPERMITRSEADGRQRCRVMLSPPEYERLLGVSRAGPAPLGGIVRLSSAPDGYARDTAVLVPGGEAAGVIAASSGTAAQRLMMLDLLGLAGGPAATPGRGSREAPWDRALAGVPVVDLQVADMSLLPVLPLWELLARFLPWLEEAR